MPEKRWKQLERHVAKLVGGRRIPVTGERHGADILSPMFAYQVKSRRSLPTWLWEWLSGIRHVAQEGQVGVLVLHQPGGAISESLVIVAMADWVALHGQDGLPARQDAPGPTIATLDDPEEG